MPDCRHNAAKVRLCITIVLLTADLALTSSSAAHQDPSLSSLLVRPADAGSRHAVQHQLPMPFLYPADEPPAAGGSSRRHSSHGKADGSSSQQPRSQPAGALDGLQALPAAGNAAQPPRSIADGYCERLIHTGETRPDTGDTRHVSKGGKRSKHKDKSKGPQDGFTGGIGVGTGKGPQNGFTGGRPPVRPVCDSIPGCQYCPDKGRCQQCFYSGLAKFVKNGKGGCECPPGYGKLLNYTQPPLTERTPCFADKCLPCSRETFSPGGPIGKAQCQPCRSGTSTGKGKGFSACLVTSTCNIGQQPAAQALGCVPCPIGTYQPIAGAQGCLHCPTNYTTPGTGSTSILDCTVPVCPPGTQLVKQPNTLTGGFGYWCINCTGLDFSRGGLPEQGEAQRGLCKPCPAGQVPNITRNACYSNICPPPDAFFISCNTRFLPPTQVPCSALSGPIPLDTFCSAYPEGAQLTWFKGSALNPLTPLFANPLNPAIVSFPCDSSGTTFYYPFITGWKGFRNDCLCVSGQTNCYFSNGVFQPGVAGTPNTLGNPVVSIQVVP